MLMDFSNLIFLISSSPFSVMSSLVLWATLNHALLSVSMIHCETTTFGTSVRKGSFDTRFFTFKVPEGSKQSHAVYKSHES